MKFSVGVKFTVAMVFISFVLFSLLILVGMRERDSVDLILKVAGDECVENIMVLAPLSNARSDWNVSIVKARKELNCLLYSVEAREEVLRPVYKRAVSAMIKRRQQILQTHPKLKLWRVDDIAYLYDCLNDKVSAGKWRRLSTEVNVIPVH